MLSNPASAGGEEEKAPYSWLLLRHFPPWLTAGDKESLLTHFGAVQVVAMPTKGRMVSFVIKTLFGCLNVIWRGQNEFAMGLFCSDQSDSGVAQFFKNKHCAE